MESSAEGCENDCQEDCNEEPALQICKCMRIAEHASRFNLRLLEALRYLRNEREPGELVSSSTVDEIVRFFEQNYRDVGDLHSQVETGLRQICSQGLAMELFHQEYYFVGPQANSMNINARNISEKPTQCLACSSSKSVQDCTPISCKIEEPAKSNNATGCSRRERDFSRKERRTKSASSSGCSDCNVKAGCRNVDNSIVGHQEVGRNVSLNASNQSRKSKSANRQSNPGKRKRNSCQARRRNSSGRRSSVRNGQAIRDVDEDDDNEDGLSEDTDEIYKATRGQNLSQRSKTRERELKSWIKRCRKKCQDRSTH